MLQAEGHDATHVRLVEMQGASDEEVMAYAVSSNRVLVTTDTDFGALLALSGAAGPSVMLLRGVGDGLEERFSVIAQALDVVAEELLAGVIALVEPDRIRLRQLPIDGDA